MVGEDRLTEVKQQLFQLSKQYKVTFGEEHGRAVLLDLRQQFEHNTLIADNPHDMVVRAAQREMIDYINRMLRLEGDE